MAVINNKPAISIAEAAERIIAKLESDSQARYDIETGRIAMRRINEVCEVPDCPEPDWDIMAEQQADSD